MILDIHHQHLNLSQSEFLTNHYKITVRKLSLRQKLDAFRCGNNFDLY